MTTAADVIASVVLDMVQRDESVTSAKLVTALAQRVADSLNEAPKPEPTPAPVERPIARAVESLSAQLRRTDAITAPVPPARIDPPVQEPDPPEAAESHIGSTGSYQVVQLRCTKCGVFRGAVCQVSLAPDNCPECDRPVTRQVIGAQRHEADFAPVVSPTKKDGVKLDPAIHRPPAKFRTGPGKLCTIDGCDAPMAAKGLCKKHYNASRKGGAWASGSHG